MCTLSINKEFNGIELSFESKPIAATLEAIKNIGFRWHNTKKIWYAKNTPERLELAKIIANTEDYAQNIKAESKTEPKEKINKYGVQIGDVFYESWGYEQTTIDFWQVTELKGTTQIVLSAINGTETKQCGFCSVMVKPLRDSFTKHYAGEKITKTVKVWPNGDIWCNAEHGLLSKTTWDAEHNETSYY